MDILIIEDEPLVAKDLKSLITRLVPDSRIVGEVSSVESSRKWFADHGQPELVLADIQLSDGISFEIFESLDISCPVIFTTAYDNYAIRAFKINSIDYLLKPVDPEDLKRAFDKYHSLSVRWSPDNQLRTMITQLRQGGKAFKERFLVLQGTSMVPVMGSDIAYFCKDQLIYLYTMRNEKFICEFQALDDIEELLDPAIFFRLNRQAVVHLQAISKVKTTHKGLSVFLKGPLEAEFDVSREKAAAFKKWLG